MKGIHTIEQLALLKRIGELKLINITEKAELKRLALLLINREAR